MPEEDVSYEGPEPQIYRKYSENVQHRLFDRRKTNYGRWSTTRASK